MAIPVTDSVNINNFRVYYNSLSWFAKWFFPINVNTLTLDIDLLQAVATYNEASWLFKIQCWLFTGLNTFFNSNPVKKMKTLLNFQEKYPIDILDMHGQGKHLSFDYSDETFSFIEKFKNIKIKDWAKDPTSSNLFQLILWGLTDEKIEQCCRHSYTSDLVTILSNYLQYAEEVNFNKAENQAVFEKILNHSLFLHLSALITRDFIGSIFESLQCSVEDKKIMIDHILTIDPSKLYRTRSIFSELKASQLLTRNNIDTLFEQLKLVTDVQKFDRYLTKYTIKNDNLLKFLRHWDKIEILDTKKINFNSINDLLNWINQAPSQLENLSLDNVSTLPININVREERIRRYTLFNDVNPKSIDTELVSNLSSNNN